MGAKCGLLKSGTQPNIHFVFKFVVVYGLKLVTVWSVSVHNARH